MSEGFGEDRVNIPDPGLDAKRMGGMDTKGVQAQFDVTFSVPGNTHASSGVGTSTFTDVGFTDVDGDGTIELHPTFGENDFPRQKGNDSLFGDEAVLS